MATTPNYDINYEDERFDKVKTEETAALTETEQTYNKVMGNASSMYDDLKEATEQWKNTQTDIQNQQTDFTIQQIEQQKEQAQKDYTKEQAGAYVDWRKQSNQYGSEAEKMASAGLANTGYSESSQVAMYNTYQNRIAVARESFQQSWTNLNNKITEAKLQNNAALAEIALQAFQQQAEYTLASAQYQNQLLLDLADKKFEVKQFYANQWQNVLDQMNKENALAEEVRQYNETQAWQTEQNELERQWQTEQAELDRQWKTEEAKLDRDYQTEKDRLDRQHELDLQDAKTEDAKELADKAHEQALAELDRKLENDKKFLAYEQSLKSTTFSGGSGGSGGSSKVGTRATNAYNLQKTLTNKVANAANNASKPATGKTTQATLNSITALGYGPISASKLDQLVASGQVIEYVQNGVTLFKRAGSGGIKLPSSQLRSMLPNTQSVKLPTSKFKK